MSYLSKRSIIIFVLIVAISPISKAYANPYFYLTTSQNFGVTGVEHTVNLRLYTDGSTLTAAQTQVNFNPTYLTGVRFQTLSSRCSFWAPADPSLGYGSSATPYFHNQNKAVFSCGFSNPGYTSSSTGGLIASISFMPISSASATLSFSNTQFRYIGNTITPGAQGSLELTFYGSTIAAIIANPSPTPTPSPVPDAPPPVVNVDPEPEDTLSEDDFEFVTIESRTTVGSRDPNLSGDTPGALSLINQDDTIPAPPSDLPARDRPTPYIIPDRSESEQSDTNDDNGEVLSVSSLRELLIPGKSEADRTVVLFNLISTLTFLTLLGIAIWRMLTLSRINRIKYQHLQESLAGELAVIQSKMGALNQTKDNKTAESEIKKSFESLVDQFEENS